MKINYRILFPAIIIVVLSSCKKDEKIAIDNLIGKWTVANDDPKMAVDGSVTYKFNSDMTCIKNIYDALSNRDTAIYRTYVLSNDKTLVTLYDERKIYTEQYLIKKLNTKEMKWENASPNDGNENKMLVRSNDQQTSLTIMSQHKNLKQPKEEFEVALEIIQQEYARFSIDNRLY